jgi:hypothetical protein
MADGPRGEIEDSGAGRTLVLWTTDSCTMGLICNSRSVSIVCGDR